MLITKKHVLSFLLLTVLSFFQIGLLGRATAAVAQSDNTLLESQTGLDLVAEKFGSADVGDVKDIRAIIIQILNIALGLLGMIMVVLIVFSGYQWMTAGGNEEQIEKAKKRITNAVIGLVIILAAWTITNFVIRRAICATEYVYNPNFCAGY
jgi:amino acid transporter